jgi:hypothetical protein
VIDGNLTWAKSSYSGSQGGNCLEAAADGVGRVLVRDTKDRGGAVLEFRASRWREFSASLKTEAGRELSDCAKSRKARIRARNTTFRRKSPQGRLSWTCGDSFSLLVVHWRCGE